MPVIPADIRYAQWRTPTGWGSFRPNGKIYWVGTKSNPTETWGDLEKPTYAARFFIGFKVGNEDKWTIDDLVKIVKHIRQDQGKAPDSTFVAQKGLYTSKAGEIVYEDGAQLIIINDPETPYNEFKNEMVKLGEQLCVELEQEKVVLELQANGLVQVTYGVKP